MKKIIIGAAVAAILTTGAVAADKTFSELTNSVAADKTFSELMNSVAADKTFSELTNSDMKYIYSSGKCELSEGNEKGLMIKYFTKNRITQQTHVPIGSIYVTKSLMDSEKVLTLMFFTNLDTCTGFIKMGNHRTYGTQNESY